MTPNPFPISVTEENHQYWVRISPQQKERAKRIPGRRWDGEIRAWVYPRTLQVYEDLKNEFERDAQIFEIRKPKRVPSPPPQRDPQPYDDEIFEDDWKNLTEKTTSIHDQFSSLSTGLTRLLEDVKIIRESNNSIQKQLELATENSSEATDDSSSREALNKMSVGWESREDLDVLEKSLLLLAFAISGREPSFAKWIQSHNPLHDATRFITRSHEHIFREMAQMLGEETPDETRFAKFIHALKDQQLVPSDRTHNVPSLLHVLNNHRNSVIHSKTMSDSELKGRSIIYMLNLAMIWGDIAADAIEE